MVCNCGRVMEMWCEASWYENGNHVIETEYYCETCNYTQSETIQETDSFYTIKLF